MSNVPPAAVTPPAAPPASPPVAPAVAERSKPEDPRRESLVESLQALIVAFVLAMAFRSFVLEGFVIPTGSMAPTLMGQHVRYRSPVSGYEFALDAAPAIEALRQRVDARNLVVQLRDPMVWTPAPRIAEPVVGLARRARSGDRVLVLKALYPFSPPRRFDVVVFKNPTDPFGDAQNYIKRLVGLPIERLLFADGDVFAGPLDGTGIGDLRVQRKPRHVQRAVWQPIHDLDWPPFDRDRLGASARGMPWALSGLVAHDDRSLRSVSADRATLAWDASVRPIDDWTAYNAMRDPILTFPTSDLRVAASISADDPAALRSELHIAARRHVFAFTIEGGQATVSMWPGEQPERVASASHPIRLPRAGRCGWFEFWHVDQRLSIHLDGREIVALEYEWNAEERLLNALNGRTLEQYAANPVRQLPTPPQLRWSIDGTPIEIRRLRLDRDLHYQPTILNPRNEQFAENGPAITGLGFGTDPFAPARIGADHFLMLGDNSAASRDGRVWGRPHPLIGVRFESEEPFLVHRRLLLGKAWSVYLPSPMPFGDEGRNLIPDFGRLRFIR